MMSPPYFGLQTRAEAPLGVIDSEDGDPHLRSVVEVIGYEIHALDGDIGHVENFMFENADWSLRYFVDTSNWWLGKRVLIAMEAVKGVDWSDRHVRLDVTREAPTRFSRPGISSIVTNTDRSVRRMGRATNA